MTLQVPIDHVRLVRTLHVNEIQGSPLCFYTHFAHEPLIIKGVFAEDHPLGSLSWDTLEALLAAETVSAYSSTAPGSLEVSATVSATTLFREVREGVARCNVIDHSIVGRRLGELFDVPPFLGLNWFLDAGPPGRSMEKSLVVTPPGSFTPLHMDAYGMQGWMYLIEGCKRWEIFPPGDVFALFDPIFKEFFDPRMHDARAFPLLPSAKKYVGTIEGGDLFYFPGAWPHQVETAAPSFGVGGSLINEFQIEAHMRWWLWERTLRLQGPLDLKQLLLDLPTERFATPAGQARTQAALALCRAWEARMHELGTAA